MAQSQRVVVYAPIRWILLIVAVLLFLLATFGVKLGSVDLVDLGLALGFGSFLVP